MARLMLALCVVGIIHCLTTTSEGVPMYGNVGVVPRDGYNLQLQREDSGRDPRYIPRPSCQPLGFTCGPIHMCCGGLYCVTEFKDHEGVCW